MENDTKTCRTCLTETNSYSSLFRPGKICGEIINLSEVLHKCTPLRFEENDGLPGQLCHKCTLLAGKSYSFMQQCLRADVTLRQTQVKEDPEPLRISMAAKPHHTYGAAPKNRNKLLVSVEHDGNESIKIFNVSDVMVEEAMDPNGDSLDHDADTEDENIEYVTVMVSDNDFDDQIDTSLDQADEATIVEGEVEADAGESIDDPADSEYTLDDEKPRRRKARQNFKCDECGKVLSNFGSYKYHLQLHSDVTPFQCNKCDASFKTKNAFDGHMITHDPNNPHSCHICGKKYRQAASLEGHLRSHTGEKPFLCGICGKGMTQKSGFKKHMLTHTGDRPYQCDICQKTFRYSSNLIMHKKSHVDEREFECNQCQKRFVTKEQLKRHVVIHMEAKRSQCTICHRIFDRPYRLAVHMRRHKGVSIKICKICGDEFSELNELQAHMMEAHSRPHAELTLMDTDSNTAQ